MEPQGFPGREKAIKNLFDQAVQELRSKKEAGISLSRDENRAIARKDIAEKNAAEEKRKGSIEGVYSSAIEDIKLKKLSGASLDTVEEAAYKRATVSGVKQSKEDFLASQKEKLVRSKLKNHVQGEKKTKEVNLTPESNPQFKPELTGAAWIQHEIYDALSSFEGELHSYLERKSQKTGSEQEGFNQEAVAFVARKIISSLDHIDGLISRELGKYSNDDTSEEERKLELLADHVYLEKAKLEDVASGKSTNLPDASEYEEDVDILGGEGAVEELALPGQEPNRVHVKVEPTIPDAFLPEKPQPIGSEKKQYREKITLSIPEAFLSDAGLDVSDEQFKTERLPGMQKLLTPEEINVMPALSEEEYNAVTERLPGISAEDESNEVTQKIRVQFSDFSSPEVYNVEALQRNLDDDTFSKETKQKIEQMRAEIWSLYGVDVNKQYYTIEEKGKYTVPVELQGLLSFDNQASSIKMEDALIRRARSDVKNWDAREKALKEAGFKLTTFEKIEQNDAIQRLYTHRLEYNKRALDLNYLSATLILAKDRKKGVEAFHAMMVDGLNKVAKLRNIIYERCDLVRDAYFSKKFISPTRQNRLNMDMDFREKYASHIVEELSNSPFGTGTSEDLHLESLYGEMLSMRAEISHYFADQSADQLVKNEGIDEALNKTLQQFATPESKKQITDAVLLEVDTRYRGMKFTDLERELFDSVLQYTEKKSAVDALLQKRLELKKALENMDFDTYGYHTVLSNIIVMSWVEKWKLRRNINTKKASQSDLSALIRIGEEMQFLSADAVEALRSNNISFKTINEIISGYEKIGEKYLTEEGELHEMSTEIFAKKELIKRLKEEDLNPSK